MMKKWKDSRGETLVEVLAAILIGSLSVTLIFGAIMASATMDRQAQDTDKSYYEALSKAERQDPAADKLDAAEGAPAWEIKVAPKTGAEVTIKDVTFYGGKGAVSYALTPEGGEGP